MKVVIASGGKAPSKALIEAEIRNSDYVICADSGANYLYDYDIMPNYLVGDFDSINKEAYNFYASQKCVVLTYPTEKDYTDTELALKKAIDLGADEVVFLGCTGSRLDHIFGNLGLLRKCLNSGIKGSLKDDSNTILITDKSCEIEGIKGMTFSIQAFCDLVDSVSIEGAKYPLKDYMLRLGDPLTVSNEFLSEKVRISFKDGLLLIFYSRD